MIDIWAVFRQINPLFGAYDYFKFAGGEILSDVFTTTTPYAEQVSAPVTATANFVGDVAVKSLFGSPYIILGAVGLWFAHKEGYL